MFLVYGTSLDKKYWKLQGIVGIRNGIIGRVGSQLIRNGIHHADLSRIRFNGG